LEGEREDKGREGTEGERVGKGEGRLDWCPGVPSYATGDCEWLYTAADDIPPRKGHAEHGASTARWLCRICR